MFTQRRGCGLVIAVASLVAPLFADDSSGRRLYSQDELVQQDIVLKNTVKGSVYTKGITKAEVKPIKAGETLIPFPRSHLSFCPIGLTGVNTSYIHREPKYDIVLENLAGADGRGEFSLQIQPSPVSGSYLDNIYLYGPQSDRITKDVVERIRKEKLSDLATLDLIAGYSRDNILAEKWPLSAEKFGLFQAFVSPLIRSGRNLDRLIVGKLVLYVSGATAKSITGRSASAAGVIFDANSGRWIGDFSLSWESLPETDAARLQGLLSRLNLATQ